MPQLPWRKRDAFPRSEHTGLSTDTPDSEPDLFIEPLGDYRALPLSSPGKTAILAVAKRLASGRDWLYLYPEPEPFPYRWSFWFAQSLVLLLAALFAGYFIHLLTLQQDAFLSPAEDLGIMNQAVWSMTQGQLFHQTICNIISDTNCAGLAGISRFAIHFEPILLPISLLYALWPGPEFLLIVQTLVVASGALPAFWLARLRLRNDWAALLIAAIYLLFPELQQAEAFFFHAVTMTAAFLLFLLYALYTRRRVWIFVFALLAMACKEEIALLIFLLGIWSILFQRCWRVGLSLLGLALGWLCLTLLVFHLVSPSGHALLSVRYSDLGAGPLDIVRTIVQHPLHFLQTYLLESEHRHYLRLLLAPVAYLPLLTPWVFLLASPTIALNLLSSDRNMRLGFFQYNAEIVPLLLFSTIEALVLLFWLAQHMRRLLKHSNSSWYSSPVTRLPLHFAFRESKNWLQPLLLMLMLSLLLISVLRQDQTYGAMPFSRGISIPQITRHNQLARRLIAMIPASASVSAQDNLVPHISQRQQIYLFPYGVGTADYIFLDVSSDSVYPYQEGEYTSHVRALLLSGDYGLLAAQDGYLLLRHGLTEPSGRSPARTGSAAVPQLPASFCTFLNAPEESIPHPLNVHFSLPAQRAGGLNLMGYQVALPDSFSIITRYLQVTTYWRIAQIRLPALNLRLTLVNDAGKKVFQSDDVTALQWCPTTGWQPGTFVVLKTSLLYIGDVPDGPIHVDIALLPKQIPSVTMEDTTDGLPFQVVQAPGTVRAAPGKQGLQLQTFTVSW